MLNLNPLVSTLYFLQMFRTAFCIGIFNSKNLPIFLLRRFMPLFIIPLSTLEVNDFQPMGITPAYAGKSDCLIFHRIGTWDHPRLCGEKGIALINPEDSPYISLRITPAYAGKSFGSPHYTPRCQDHPRLCGEKLHVISLVSFIPGSPPPMRGKGHSKLSILWYRGITPAYAGKSAVLASRVFRAWGSPPPMRGKVL